MTNSAPMAINMTQMASSARSSISAKTCHISVVRNSTTAKSINNGTARATSGIDATSCVTSRAPAQRTIDSSPKPTTPQARAG